MTDIFAQPDRLAAGTIIEANLDRNRGPICTLLVQNGTLRVGDPIVAGAAFGKVENSQLESPSLPSFFHWFSWSNLLPQPPQSERQGALVSRKLRRLN